MKIGIDTRCLEWQRGGVARFVVKYLELAPKIYASDTFILYFQDFIPEDDFLKQSNVKCVLISGPKFLKKRRIICEQILLPFAVWKERIDLFFSPWYTCPLLLLNKKIIVAAWDISYITHPSHYSFSNRISLGLIGKITYKYSNAIITCSQFDAEQILKYTNTKPENLLIFNFPAEDKFDEELSIDYVEKSLTKLDIKKPYILSLGVIYNRRNLPSLLSAFKILSQQKANINLVIVGKNATNPRININNIINDLSLNDKVVCINYLDEKDLLPVYKGAELFFCTSDVDGEAILVKEALRAGIPVVSSKLLEKTINGYGKFIVNPRDEVEIANAINDVLENKSQTEEISIQGRAWIKSIKWDDEIIKTHDFIKSK